MSCCTLTWQVNIKNAFYLLEIFNSFLFFLTNKLNTVGSWLTMVMWTEGTSDKHGFCWKSRGKRMVNWWNEWKRSQGSVKGIYLKRYYQMKEWRRKQISWSFFKLASSSCSLFITLVVLFRTPFFDYGARFILQSPTVPTHKYEAFFLILSLIECVDDLPLKTQ